METENKDWKPEVGKTAWFAGFDSVYEILITDVLWEESQNPWYKGTIWFHPLTSEYNAEIGTWDIFPTSEAALASIKIYDLEGKEVVVPRARSLFNGKYFNWMLRDEAGQTSGLPHVKPIPMRTIEEENAMLSPSGEKFLIDKQEYFDWCLRNKDTLCMFLDSKIRGGAAIGGKSDRREGGC